ncbi:porin [Noviherbaspirillum saxi]|uniref:Porin n=2 Tax=Noviherbaspirillum saxi TaxID=2320863 RepID=A0A3A3FJ20_9BURK|nr:porin [Noviherbaspirillum saxi]RJF95488.1 porin [Noviherbaspirillum saxi]
MKKTLCIMLGASAMASAAWAQTNVAIYGIVDAGIVRESGGVAGSVTKLGSGIASGSRIGFRGREDLGGGMAAQFVLETGTNIDTGAMGQGGLLFGRQAHVGLSTGAGTLTFGRQYTPLFMAVNAVDPFLGFSMAGSANNILSEGGIRMNNTVKYAMPATGPFTADIAYGFGEVAGDSSAGRNVGASVGYSSGPLSIRLAYHRANNVPAAGVAPDDGRSILLGGVYNFGVAKFHLGVQSNKGLITINGRAIPRTDSRDVLVGVTVPFGVSSVMASYIRKDARSALNRDANQMAIGVTYPLSKRTDLYASYARIDNDAAAGTANFYTVGNGSDTGTGDKAFNFGIRHTF